MQRDKMIVTITLERNVNGTANYSTRLDGEGWHIYEVLGMLEVAKRSLVERSVTLGKELPDRPTRLQFDDSNTEIEGDKSPA